MITDKGLDTNVDACRNVDVRLAVMARPTLNGHDERNTCHAY